MGDLERTTRGNPYNSQGPGLAPDLNEKRRRHRLLMPAPFLFLVPWNFFVVSRAAG